MLCGSDCRCESVRRDNEADAEARQCGLGKGSDIDHLAVWIQGSERLEGTVAESELAVIVILNDRGVGLPSPLEEARAALQRHGHANRKLMRRCDINQPGV